MAQVFTTLFNLAMRLERERFLGAPSKRRDAFGASPSASIHAS
jgi:hypothetical protein